MGRKLLFPNLDLFSSEYPQQTWRQIKSPKGLEYEVVEHPCATLEVFLPPNIIEQVSIGTLVTVPGQVEKILLQSTPF